MRKLPIAALAFALVFAAMQAQAAEVKASVDLDVGYRTDNLEWNKGSSTINPISELEWSDLQITVLEAGIRMSYNRFHARGSFGYGFIISGDNRDSDWALPGRRLEYSRTNNSADNGHVLDASIGAGYEFEVGRLSIIPLAGYSLHQQDLTVTDGVQTIATVGTTPPLGPIAGLYSTYEPRWQGPWLGVDLAYRPSERVRLFSTFEYHIGTFEAEANWNLRTDLAHPKSFEQDADAQGFVIAGGMAYSVKDRLDIGLGIDYTQWKTDTGTDRIFRASGATITSILNEVTWKSFSVTLNATYRF